MSNHEIMWREKKENVIRTAPENYEFFLFSKIIANPAPLIFNNVFD